MKNRWKKFLKLNNWKRFVIGFITIISAIIAIVLGSTLYISKNVNKSIEYGGGVEVLVQVKKDGKDADKQLTEQVNKSLFERLTGGTGLNGITVSSEGDGKIRITKSGAITDSQRIEFEKEIVDKPILTITNAELQPLFYDGNFKIGNSINTTPVDELKPNNWIPPFKQNSASVSSNTQDGKTSVSLKLENNDAVLQWTKATEYVSSQQDHRMLMWLNIEKLLKLAQNRYPDDWEASGHNLWNFIHVGNQATSIEYSPNGQPKYTYNALKTHQFNAREYLISDANVNGPLNTADVQITGNFTPQEASELANKINFGLSDYELSVLSNIYLNPNLNANAFDYAMYAGIVIFTLISLFMLVNYGLLGALSTISIALYIFLTLLIFTVLRGEYSPATIAALIIGIGISVDANVITYERLKRQVYTGDSLKKSFRNANKLSLSSILDANVTTIIVGFILFYFGTKEVRGFSVTLVLSILFTLLIMLVFSRFLATMLVNSGLLDDKLYLLGIRKRYINHKTKLGIAVENNNYLKQAKWFALGSLIFVLIGIIVFASISGAKGQFWGGFNLALEFSGGTNITITADVGAQLTNAQALEIKNDLIANAQKVGVVDMDSIISISRVSSSSDNWAISIKTPQTLNVVQLQQIKDIVLQHESLLKVIDYSISSLEAQKLVLNAVIATAIAFAGIILYLLFRMSWTYSLAAIIGLLHDFLMVMAFIVITRLQVSTIIVAAMLSILGLSINDTVVTFDKIRETIKTQYINKILDKQDIDHIVNSSIAETLKRSLYTSGTTILAILVLLCFNNATDFSFNIVMLFGISIGVYSSIYICSWVWSKLELHRQGVIARRIKTGYWDINHPDEQTFVGINDYI
ncbi:protein translocase subunit SecDF [Mycoplasmopsis verecunda]|uniref:SecD/SecF fusion protein n=1 Tax=Mycoplasmopsis verecunda TaxID=171291 RepID=A0A1T4KXR1_9BACT|nr:protein translocase subunit SecDF [Mycoplasmopsis verecunda]WPB54333.1 protein translocase subunit SecDF [Mycoplasmopsis verecunda]SJZ47181.1 SecD/SecF fusion protein [Mycoplasmopsis verecunda]